MTNVPSIDSILLYDKFPRTSNGNIKKRELKEAIFNVKIGYTTSLASISPSEVPAERASVTFHSKDESVNTT